MISISLMILVSMIAVPVVMLACLLSDSIPMARQQLKTPVRVNPHHK